MKICVSKEDNLSEILRLIWRSHFDKLNIIVIFLNLLNLMDTSSVFD